MMIFEKLLATFVISFLIFIIYNIILGYREEKRWWNNGVCPKNNQPWVFFGMDSQGGRGYKTPDNKHVCWMSWNHDNFKKGTHGI